MALLQAFGGLGEGAEEPAQSQPQPAPAPAPEPEPVSEAWQAQVAAAQAWHAQQAAENDRLQELQELQAQQRQLEAQMQMLNAQSMHRVPQTAETSGTAALQRVLNTPTSATGPARSVASATAPAPPKAQPALLQPGGLLARLQKPGPLATIRPPEEREGFPKLREDGVRMGASTDGHDDADGGSCWGKGKSKGKGGKLMVPQHHETVPDRSRAAGAWGVDFASQGLQGAQGALGLQGTQSIQGSQDGAASSSSAQLSSALSAEDDEAEKLRCHLHKKPLPACKFCIRYVKAKRDVEAKAKQRASNSRPAKKLVFNCSPLLMEQVVKSSYYRSLTSITTFDGFVQEIVEYAADTMDVYKSTMEPSCFMCCVYRLYTFALEEEDLRRITDSHVSTVVRCVGFLFIRYTVPPEELWEKLEEFILDDAKIQPRDGGKASAITVGEYIEGLLLKDKYYSTPLPRIPASVRRKLEEKIAPLTQYRKRTSANHRIFSRGLPEANMPVEVSIGGHWHYGRATEVLTKIPSRLKVRVKLESGDEHVAHIGKVVLRGPVPALDMAPERSRSRSRSRSPSQQGRSLDWSRHKGKSDAQMVEELRGRAREEAVCSDRKGYAKRLPRYETGLAIKREKGSAEASLIEEETLIKVAQRARVLTEEEEEEIERARRRIAHEEDERQRKLKDIYERYGQQKSRTAGAKASDLEGPDTLRLG